MLHVSARKTSLYCQARVVKNKGPTQLTFSSVEGTEHPGQHVLQLHYDLFPTRQGRYRSACYAAGSIIMMLQRSYACFPLFQIGFGDTKNFVLYGLSVKGFKPDWA